MKSSDKGYLYYPGCTIKANGLACEESLQSLFRLLEIPLKELPDWNCCGATSYMAIDEIAAFILAARNLSIVCQEGYQELVTPCSACYLALKKTQDYIHKYPVIKEQVDHALQRAGLPPFEFVKIRHPLEVLYHDVGLEKIKSLAARRWQGGPIACYYGCQIVRPYPEVDKPYNPMRMDELLRAVGIPTIEYSLKTRCCGGSLTGTIHSVGVRLNDILLKEAIRKGAQAMVTMCALCQFNLDVYQSEIQQETGDTINIPILYLTQVLGWMLGSDLKSLGIHRSISGRELIKQWFTERKEVEAYV
jgi:heterodisulfide reductase subunit B